MRTNLKDLFTYQERKLYQVKRLGNNFIRYYKDAKLIYKLHKTDIVIFKLDGSITLNSNRWQTVTTKKRMNEILRCRGFYITQKNFKWTIYSLKDTNYKVNYYDGITLFPIS